MKFYTLVRYPASRGSRLFTYFESGFFGRQADVLSTQSNLLRCNFPTSALSAPPPAPPTHLSPGFPSCPLLPPSYTYILQPASLTHLIHTMKAGAGNGELWGEVS